MKLEVLISAVNADPQSLIEKMKIETDAVLINQCGNESETTLDLNKNKIRVYNYAEKGVGASRNRAIEKSSGDILLFSDDDIVYDENYARTILNEFEEHKDADVLFFNVRVNEKRRTYWNEDFSRVHIWNGGRYPAYSIAIRREALIKADVKFSLLFGGGAKYSCGEDSLFIRDCLKNHLKLFRTPKVIGMEEERKGGESTWFKGYNEKFFFDRGVLYRELYGCLAGVMGFRFVYLKRNEMCRDIPWRSAFAILKEGIREKHE